MKVIVAVAVLSVVIAVVAGVVAFRASGGDARCDYDALRAAMQESIRRAEVGGMAQTQVNLPRACTDDDLAQALPGVSRSWHVMPGGSLMRQPTHTTP